MRRTDFYIQTGLILTGVITGITAIGTHNNIVFVMLAQLLLGPWQMLSALFYIGLKTTYKRSRQIHLVTSSVYLIILYLLWSSFRDMDSVLVSLISMVPAWILAIHYYTITCLTVFPKKKNDSAFLPHLNF